MPTKLSLHRYLWFFFLAFMAACGTANPPATYVPTSVFALQSPAPLPTFSFPSVSATPASTTRVGPTPLVNKQVMDAWRTQIAQATPIRTPVARTNLEKFPAVAVQDGNLFFRRRAGYSVKLTGSGKDRDPVLSDDGRKIVFYRGETYDNLYFINSDGSRNQAILTNETPLLIGKGEIYSPAFVPGTHILLFNTYLCGPKKGLYDYADCSISVYSLDTDTGEIHIVAENIEGNAMRSSNFEISPDGQYVSVAGMGHIDLYGFSSGHFEIAYRNVITYSITPPDEYLPRQYWLPDSSGLIMIPAADGQYNEPATPPALYIAFRYTIKEKQTVKIPLDKFIVWDVEADSWSISPDRNWILFAGSETNMRGDYSLHYLGNLIDGHTQAFGEIGWPLYDCTWSQDSKHFALRNGTPSFIGSVDGSPIVTVSGSFDTWIDTTHYYYKVFGDTSGTTKVYIGEISDH